MHRNFYQTQLLSPAPERTKCAAYSAPFSVSPALPRASGNAPARSDDPSLSLALALREENGFRCASRARAHTSKNERGKAPEGRWQCWWWWWWSATALIDSAARLPSLALCLCSAPLSREAKVYRYRARGDLRVCVSIWWVGVVYLVFEGVYVGRVILLGFVRSERMWRILALFFA